MTPLACLDFLGLDWECWDGMGEVSAARFLEVREGEQGGFCMVPEGLVSGAAAE